MSFRTERDSMGEVQLPAEALYQAQTQRALDNFQISALTMPAAFIKAVLKVKQAAAAANLELKLLEPEVAAAIHAAAEQQLLELNMANYPIDLFQTGSGTSTNMNVNEVLATLASKSSGLHISPNDHINLGQSSNDVIPTAIHLSAAVANHQLMETLVRLEAAIATKAQEVGHIVKTGRTHLMDAMPVTFAQVLSGWQAQIAHARQQLEFAQQQVVVLAQGGTAVGTGVNAHPEFATLFCQKLSSQAGLKFKPSSNFFFSLGSQDSVVALSGATKVLAVALMKIANDLRWMNSGPLAGLGEIALPALQPGSSIMPGKVNPVIPEAVAMVAAQVIGNDATITVAGQSGNFELNVMLPVIAHNILQSLELLSSASAALGEKAIAGFTVQTDKINEALSRNPILVTALNPLIGYLKAADIAKQAYKEKRPVIDVAVEQTSYSRAELEKLLDPALLSQG
ncbi:class II fumarate hydratase [Rheinheimera mangrovi]|uniref:class II fumarate hydratase n=1 Tax=Rheinheimera mangrovi TaxID=2498451 RepID=UPI000F8F1BE6|nr:class II fumarate hydratase [Rheinheimera mangrovi]